MRMRGESPWGYRHEVATRSARTFIAGPRLGGCGSFKVQGRQGRLLHNSDPREVEKLNSILRARFRP